MKKKGVFTISLDFELYWGVKDVFSITQYERNLLGVEQVVSSLLHLFAKHNIHSTWATVGLIMAKDINEARLFIPQKIPSYQDNKLSPYEYINESWCEKYDSVHFRPDLVKKIRDVKFQEIATHTFCHYYATDLGQTTEQFKYDIESAINISKPTNIRSIVFPKNQVNPSYLEVLKGLGISAYRGNEKSWLYSSSKSDEQNSLKRLLRLLDSYINISGHNTTSTNLISDNGICNIPSSRFLRPYSKKLRFFNGLKLQRIKKSMTFAAKNNEVFHLWWHPHNFGTNLNENISFLEDVLQHYQYLKQKYGMASLNMEEISDLIMQTKQDG